MPALANARVALLTAVMAAAPSSASTSLVSRTAKGKALPRGTTPALRLPQTCCRTLGNMQALVRLGETLQAGTLSWRFLAV